MKMEMIVVILLHSEMKKDRP